MVSAPDVIPSCLSQLRVTCKSLYLMEVATEGANNPRLPSPGVQIQSIKRVHEGVWGKRQQREGGAIGHLAGGR